MTDEELLAKLRAAGYASARIVGQEVRVEEELRGPDGWPLLWRLLGDREWGCGGLRYHQITKETP